MKNDWPFFLSEIYTYGLKVNNAAEVDIISSKLREPWFFRFSLIHLPSCPPAISHLLLINFQLIFRHLLQHLLWGADRGMKKWSWNRPSSFFLLDPSFISSPHLSLRHLLFLSGLSRGARCALKPPLKFNSTFKPQWGATYQQEERDFCFFICLGGVTSFPCPVRLVSRHSQQKAQ